MFTLAETMPTFVMPTDFLNVLNMSPLNGPLCDRNDGKLWCKLSHDHSLSLRTDITIQVSTPNLAETSWSTNLRTPVKSVVYFSLWQQHSAKSRDKEGVRWNIFLPNHRQILDAFLSSKGSKGVHARDYRLTDADMRFLESAHGIYSYECVQNPGESVFLPAGAPFQVSFEFLMVPIFINLHDNKSQIPISCVTISIDFVLPESIRACRAVAKEQYQHISSRLISSPASKMEPVISDAISLDYLLPEACHFLQQRFGFPGDLGKAVSSDSATFQCRKCRRKPMRDLATLKHMCVLCSILPVSLHIWS